MLKDDLLKSGIAADHIISMRYTSEDFDDGMTDIEPERITCKKNERSELCLAVE